MRHHDWKPDTFGDFSCSACNVLRQPGNDREPCPGSRRSTCPICEHPVDCSCARKALWRLVEAAEEAVFTDPTFSTGAHSRLCEAIRETEGVLGGEPERGETEKDNG